MSKKVMVIGATGAMGRHLVPELVKLGYEVTGVSLDVQENPVPGVKYYVGDCFDKEFLSQLLAQKFDGIVNYNIAAKKRGEDITFLRKIVPGPTDDSYGIEVARLAGVPGEVTRRAKEILKTLESGEKTIERRTKKAAEEPAMPMSFSFADAAADEIKEKLKNTDVNTLTPIEALNLIYEWKKLL
jgi:hypothetical protein